MRRLVKFILTLSFAFLASASCCCQIKTDTATVYRKKVFSQQVFDSLRQSRTWVYDFEDILTEKEEKALNLVINAPPVQPKIEIEIVVVTIDTTLTTKDQFDDFVLNLHNSWEVGKNVNNNGIVIGISAGFRKMRISNGYGIEKILSDAETKDVIERFFLPSFRTGHYYVGIHNGVGVLIQKLNEKL